jgi:hypothetical protein
MNWISLRRTVVGFARVPFLLLFVTFVGVSQAPAQIAVGISITVAPPVLPVYEQPPIPAPGYIWTPGYWAWNDDGDYYWVPGTWVEPPSVGLLWTPGYWACDDAGIYVWNAGYWGPHVGFYGGVNYGFGYVGIGYAGGFWRGGVFSYNRTVNNFGSVNITNVYNKTVIVNNVNNHVSFNGGAGGLTTRPNAQERMAATETHAAATGLQTQHQQQASTNRDLRASVNGGHPAVAATSQAGRFAGQGVTAAHATPGGNAAAGQHAVGAVGNHNTSGPGGSSGQHGNGGNAGQHTLSHATTNGPAAGVSSGPSHSVNSAPHVPHPQPNVIRPNGGGSPPRVANAVRGPAPRPAAAAVRQGPPPKKHP